MKLNQVIAIVTGTKTRFAEYFTKLYHSLADNRFAGMIREYKSDDDEGVQHPPESIVLQDNVNQLIPSVIQNLSDYYGLILTQENGVQPSISMVETGSP